MNRKNTTLLFGLLMLLNGIDAITTAYLIDIGDLSVEANPFMREIIRHGGALGMIAYKFLAIFALFACIMWMKLERRSLILAMVGLYLSLAVFSLISIHNLVIVYTV